MGPGYSTLQRDGLKGSAAGLIDDIAPEDFYMTETRRLITSLLRPTQQKNGKENLDLGQVSSVM